MISKQSPSVGPAVHFFLKLRSPAAEFYKGCTIFQRLKACSCQSRPYLQKAEEAAGVLVCQASAEQKSTTRVMTKTWQIPIKMMCSLSRFIMMILHPGTWPCLALHESPVDTDRQLCCTAACGKPLRPDRPDQAMLRHPYSESSPEAG